MNDQPQPEPTDTNPDLTDEFRTLGKNLVEAMRTAWESPERKRLQEEIESGLNEFGATLRQEGETFRESPTGQRLKSDFENIQERIRTGEAENRIRQELLNALKSINAELSKITERWSGPASQDESKPEPPGNQA